jgi:uncharacterized protein
MKTHSLAFVCAGRSQRIELMVAAGMLSRMRGLLGRRPLENHEGMLLKPCNLVHTLGMRYAIDVVFLRKDGLVLKVSEALPPRRASGHMRAACVLELAAGVARQIGIAPGIKLPIHAF